MSPDRVRVMVWGSQRQMDSRTRWAEPNVSRGCYTVIKNDCKIPAGGSSGYQRNTLAKKNRSVFVFHRFDHSLVINECHMWVH